MLAPASATRAFEVAHALPGYRLAIAFDLTDTYTFGMVGIIGILLLGAYQADQAQRGRLAAALIGASIAVLVGPLVILGIVLALLWYVVFLGLPLVGVAVLIRRVRRRRA